MPRESKMQKKYSVGFGINRSHPIQLAKIKTKIDKS
jgi:hypothetical protein